MQPRQKQTFQSLSETCKVLLSPYKGYSFMKNIYGAFSELENITTVEINNTRLVQYLTKNAYTFLIYLIHKD